MKKLTVGAILLGTAILMLLCFLRLARPPHLGRKVAEVPTGIQPKKANAEFAGGDRSKSTNQLVRFQREIMPLVEDFLGRVESLKSDGVVLPINLPIATNAISVPGLFFLFTYSHLSKIARLPPILQI